MFINYIKTKFRLNIVNDIIYLNNESILASKVGEKLGSNGTKRGRMSRTKSKSSIEENKGKHGEKKKSTNLYDSEVDKINTFNRKRESIPYESDSSYNSSEYSNRLTGIKSFTGEIPKKSILSRKQLVGRRSGKFARVFQRSHGRNVHWGDMPYYEDSSRRLYGIPFYKIKKQSLEKQYNRAIVRRNNRTRSYNEWMQLYSNEKDQETLYNTVFNTC